MSEAIGLLHDAKRLTTRARIKRDNAAGIQADAQFMTALNKLNLQVAGLQSQLQNRRNMVADGVAIDPSPDLFRSAERMRTQMLEYGRPTPQFVNSRSADVASLIKGLQTLNDVAWQRWAGAQLASLAVDRDQLQGDRGRAVRDKLAELEPMTRKSFNTTDYVFFKLGLAQVVDLISDLGAPLSPDEVLARIDNARGALTFADLTEEEIDVLRRSAEAARRVRLSVR